MLELMLCLSEDAVFLPASANVTIDRGLLVQAHAGSVSSLSLSEDEWVLASAGRDSTVAFWDFRHHTKLSSIPVLEPVEGAVFLPSSSALPRPTKKARTSGASSSALSSLRIAIVGSSGHLKVRPVPQT